MYISDRHKIREKELSLCELKETIIVNCAILTLTHASHDRKKIQ